VAFAVRATGVPELDAGPPADVVRENALRKARAAAPGAGEVALGVDTIVATPQRIWGKPATPDAARDTLRHLSGRTHDVVSGVALVDADAERVATAVTHVTFREIDDALLEHYVALGEWRERAGGYAIQGRGALLVTRIDGDYLNVVGLPVATLHDLAPELFG
jgi:nucleoside triphosphate pyrophosphatase